jgi:hypothetical protein
MNLHFRTLIEKIVDTVSYKTKNRGIQWKSRGDGAQLSLDMPFFQMSTIHQGNKRADCKVTCPSLLVKTCEVVTLMTLEISTFSQN